MVSAARRAARHAVEVIRLPASALQPPNAAVNVRQRPAVRFANEMFSLQLYPLQGLDVPPGTTAMPKVLGPPWLPWPPHPDTHSAHHIRLAEGARAAVAGDEDRTRYLRTTVFVSKKRVHKLAVLRNQCRTRLLAALRELVTHEDVPVRDRTFAC